jgi:hypothetical protein
VSRSLSVVRWLLFALLCVSAAGLATGVAGCGGEVTTTTVALAPSTTVTAGPITTTTAPPVTTNSQPDTTTSEPKTGAVVTESTTTTVTESTTTTLGRTWQSLVSADRTVAEAKRAPEIPKAGENQPASNVPDNLQAEFEQKFPGEEIYYIGPDNRAADPSALEGNELNDALVTLTAQGAVGARGMGYGGLNGFVYLKTRAVYYQNVLFKFVDIIPFPNSSDFIVHGTIPLVSTGTSQDVYIHVVRAAKSQYEQTLLTCFDIRKGYFEFGDALGDYGGDQIDNTSDLVANRAKHVAANLSEETLAQFFVPGDTMRAVMWIDHPGGRPLYDSYGMPVAYLLGDFRYAGAEQIEALFQ